MELVDLMRAMAARYGSLQIDGLMGVSYPVRDDVPASPWMMLRQNLEIAARYERRRLGEQIVNAAIDAVLLVASSEDRPRDQARLDPLIEPVIDAMDPVVSGQAVADLFPELAGHEIDHVFTEARVQRYPVRWGNQFCYAARITFDAQFRRKPVPVPTKEIVP